MIPKKFWRIVSFISLFIVLFVVINWMISLSTHYSSTGFLPSTPVTVLPAESAISNVNFVEQNGFTQITADLYLPQVGTGRVEILAPAKMLISETRTVKLTVSFGNTVPEQTSTPTQPLSLFQLTQQARQYPVLIAEIKGERFQILPGGPVQKTVAPDIVTEWLWAITPLAGDKQILSLALLSPVTVGSNQEILDTMQIVDLPITIEIQSGIESALNLTATPRPTTLPTATIVPIQTKESPSRLVEHIENDIGTIISGVLAFLGTVLSVYVTYIINKDKRRDDRDDDKSEKSKNAKHTQRG